MPAPLIAVDAPSLLYRAFFALPSSIRGTDDRPVNALLGFANLVLREVEAHQPRAVVLCFGAEAAAYRKTLYAPYHADRPPMPDELAEQWEDAPACFADFGWPTIHGGDLEADDVLGSLATVEADAGGRALLATGDRDMFQCATSDVAILYPARGRDSMEVIGPDEVRARYKVDPAQVPDFIALRGDPSDGLPGAPGIGEKTAATLLSAHGDLETLLELAAEEDRSLPARAATSLREHADAVRAYKDIATLRTIDVERPADGPLDHEAAAAAVRSRGMGRLADRLAAWPGG